MDDDLPDWAKPPASAPSASSTDDLPDWAKGAKPPAPKATPKEARKEAAATRTPLDDLKQAGSGIADAAEGIGETGLSAATGAVSGLVGGARALGGVALSPLTGEKPADAMHRGAEIVEKGTYQPRSESGKAIADTGSKVIAALSEPIGRTLEEIGTEGSKAFGAGDETALKMGAAGRTIGENAIPMAASAQGMRPGAGLERPPVPGKDFSPLRQFTPEQEARYRQLQDYKPTLGQVTRDPSQFRYEEQTAQRPDGAELLARKTEQNAKLIDKVEKNYPAGTKDLAPSEVGKVVRSPIEAKAAAKWQEVNDLYAEARASGETKALVNVQPIIDFLKKNEAKKTAIPELGAIDTDLKQLMDAAGKKSGPVIVDASGKMATPNRNTMISIDDLENLYTSAGQIGKRGEASGLFMGKIKDLIKDVTDGAGGDKYKAARKARDEYGKEFEEQGGVSQVLKDESRTDKKVDASKLADKLLNGSVEDLNQYLTTLKRDVKPGDKSTATVDSGALKALQRHALERTLGDTSQPFSRAGFKDRLQSMGRENLEAIWGKDLTDQMYQVAEDSRALKEAPARVSGSDTAANAQMIQDRQTRARIAKVVTAMANKLNIPGSGFVNWLADSIGKSGEAAATKAAVQEALTPTKESPIKTAEMAKATKKQIRQMNMADAKKRLPGLAAGAAIPMSAGADE